ncbi:polyketide cyclase [Amycolatopsis antarctica]|uniref:Polyketide cyclase n=1 Tax=Amycolatopsis antarctica TaxID=1854586 RepID=A0A263CWQ2_9PSEU|nr:SRPBCC domain-containing protein [Amycolatopsis antarctica]OZM70574.1 polyketide cyclase [Amycolatopsis antarctica]
MNIATQINEVLRRVGFDDTTNVVTLTQAFATTAEDLWDACTTPERLARWFEPVEGSLRLGGRYRMADSGTVGTIETCDPPHALTITWEHGGDTSRVSATIEETEPGTATLTVSHYGDNDEHWQEYGPAAGGGGWDAAFLGLRMLIDEPGSTLDEVMRAMNSEEGRRFVSDVAEQWSLAYQRAGAPAEEAAAAAGRAVALERELWTPEG